MIKGVPFHKYWGTQPPLFMVTQIVNIYEKSLSIVPHLWDPWQQIACRIFILLLKIEMVDSDFPENIWGPYKMAQNVALPPLPRSRSRWCRSRRCRSRRGMSCVLRRRLLLLPRVNWGIEKIYIPLLPRLAIGCRSRQRRSRKGMSCLLRCRGSFTVVPQRAGPVAGPVRIVPQFESFYTFRNICTSNISFGTNNVTVSCRSTYYLFIKII